MFALLFSACATPPAAIVPTCTLAATAMLPLDEASPIGFAAQRIVDLVAETTADVSYSGRPPSTVTISPVLDAPTARFEDYEVEGDASTTATCLDQVVIDGHYQFSTADGLFDESAYVPFTSWGGETVDAYLVSDPAQLSGTYTVLEVDPSAWDEVVVYAGSTWGEVGQSGGVVLEVSVGDSDPAFVDVARW